MAWLSTPHSRRDAARWFHTAQVYWTVVALLCVQCWFAAGQYRTDISYARLRQGPSVFQEVAGAALGFLELFLLLGSFGAIYLLPAAAGRWMRARREGL